ncbi:hypothetical protein RRG08_044165 [Elysia crispata]|uniref:Uncharacterized protein n=1 Tax=Elysia crispata TaxID=231223 RepID=A0AAE1CP04_9GAST|nr:hypothetical protein RRG08_044165 [Elysia crispata]
MLERGNLDHSVRVQTEGGIRREETWITQSGYRQREGSGERKPGSLSQGTDRGRDQERGNLDHSVRVQTEGGIRREETWITQSGYRQREGCWREETWITQSGYRQREGSGERKPGSLSQGTDRGRDQERGNLDHSVRVQTEGGIRREETWITQSGYRQREGCWREETWITQSGYRQREGSGERKPGSLSHGTDRGRDQERGNLDQSLKDREIEGRVVREKDTGERYTGERDTGDRKIGGRDTGDRKIEGRDTGKRDM